MCARACLHGCIAHGIQQGDSDDDVGNSDNDNTDNDKNQVEKKQDDDGLKKNNDEETDDLSDSFRPCPLSSTSPPENLTSCLPAFKHTTRLCPCATSEGVPLPIARAHGKKMAAKQRAYPLQSMKKKVAAKGWPRARCCVCEHVPTYNCQGLVI